MRPAWATRRTNSGYAPHVLGERLLLAVALAGIVPERLAQRLELTLVVAPSSDRTLADRLPHLPAARCQHRSVDAVEFQTARIPREAEVCEHAPGPELRVFEEGLVADLEQQVRWECRTPVRHQPPVLAVVVREVAEIRCVGVGGGKSLEVDRQAGV